MAEGQELEKTYDELYMPLNWISQGNPKWHADTGSSPKKVAGMFEVDQFRTISTQIAALKN